MSVASIRLGENNRNMEAMKTVAQVALRDISAYLESLPYYSRGTRHEVWFVTANSLYNKETIRLNRELGIHAVNKQHYEN
jgi:hypothetical protein